MSIVGRHWLISPVFLPKGNIAVTRKASEGRETALGQMADHRRRGASLRTQGSPVVRQKPPRVVEGARYRQSPLDGGLYQP